MRLKIKQLRRNDFGIIKKLFEKFSKELCIYDAKAKFDSVYRTDKIGINANFNYLKKEFRRHKGALFAVVCDGMTIGYAVGWINKNQKNRFTIREIGYFSDLFVDRSYRGKGIGELLAKAMLKWFKQQNLKYVDIGAYASNPIIKMYERLGFKKLYVGLRARLK